MLVQLDTGDIANLEQLFVRDEIWLMTKKHGKPSQAILNDHQYWRVRYYYESNRTEYDFEWDNINGCHSASYVHLTGDGIQ